VRRTAAVERDAPRPSSTKDTRRWCKGVVGRDHVTVWTYWFGGEGHMGNRQWEQKVCTVCHRRLKIREGCSDRPVKQDAERAQ
jgi:hypothetical protein